MVKRAHWARIQPWRRSAAAGIRARPQPLDIPEHNMRTDRQHWIGGRAPGSAYACDDTLRGRARVGLTGKQRVPDLPWLLGLASDWIAH